MHIQLHLVFCSAAPQPSSLRLLLLLFQVQSPPANAIALVPVQPVPSVRAAVDLVQPAEGGPGAESEEGCGGGEGGGEEGEVGGYRDVDTDEDPGCASVHRTQSDGIWGSWAVMGCAGDSGTLGGRWLAVGKISAFSSKTSDCDRQWTIQVSLSYLYYAISTLRLERKPQRRLELCRRLQCLRPASDVVNVAKKPRSRDKLLACSTFPIEWFCGDESDKRNTRRSVASLRKTLTAFDSEGNGQVKLTIEDAKSDVRRTDVEQLLSEAFSDLDSTWMYQPFYSRVERPMSPSPSPFISASNDCMDGDMVDYAELLSLCLWDEVPKPASISSEPPKPASISSESRLTAPPVQPPGSVAPKLVVGGPGAGLGACMKRKRKESDGAGAGLGACKSRKRKNKESDGAGAGSSRSTKPSKRMKHNR
ncbi:hypothetical protein B0H34DRAFT_676790 [Crassisporium funariophilum]|nr:hypothetical protein B0H34DRAFT_676790 [Crassisporium funariophilum]